MMVAGAKSRCPKKIDILYRQTVQSISENAVSAN